MGHGEGSSEKKVDSNIGLPEDDRKISNKQPNSTSKRTRGINKAQKK